MRMTRRPSIYGAWLTMCVLAGQSLQARMVLAYNSCIIIIIISEFIIVKLRVETNQTLVFIR